MGPAVSIAEEETTCTGVGGGTAQNQGQHEDGRSRREPSSDLPRAQSTANTEAPFGFWDDDHGTSQGSGG